ncbi:hypothetical protein BDW74DRAFT_73949 [Aspergillus multicolor]|uniref:putative GPI anchored protein n=1 Tax=Aspergillus multicolor TaxID=41759 RepID=UPI003CCCDA6C
MKGLHGGIPLAVLAATASARARANVIGHGGDDIGNAAAFAIENSASSTVTEDFKDDHSFQLEHNVKIFPGGHHDHHKRAAGADGGDDIGSAFGAASFNSFSSEVNESYKDDHSVDIEKTTIIKKPHHHRRGSDNFPEIPKRATIVKRSGGDDIGNVADFPTVNEFTSEFSETFVDDHSIDVDKTTIIKKPHHRRGGDDVGNAAFLAEVNEFSSSFAGVYKDDHSVDIDKTTIIKKPDHGNGHHGHGEEHPALGFHHPKHEAFGHKSKRDGGDDIGNAFAAASVNTFSSSFDATYTDDHSVDIDKTTIIKPHHARSWGPSGDYDLGDYDLGDYDLGDDVGNAFGAASFNSFNSQVNENYEDDHSVKVHETEVIDADDQERPSKPHEEDDDDDDWEHEEHGEHDKPEEPKGEDNWEHEEHEEHEEPEEPKGEDSWEHEEHDKPEEPTHEDNWEPEHEEHEEPEKHEEPTHEDNWEPEHEEHEEPKPEEHWEHEEPVSDSGAQEPAPPAPPVPAKEDTKSEAQCTQVEHVVQTVTETRTEVAAATHTVSVYPQPEADSEAQEPSSNQYPSAETPETSHGKGQEPGAPHYESEEGGSNYNYPGSEAGEEGKEGESNWSHSQTPSQSEDAEYPSHSDVSAESSTPSQEESTEDPSSSNWNNEHEDQEEEEQYGTHDTSDTDCANSDPVAASSAAAAPSQLFAAPSPTAQGAYHSAASSAAPVVQATTFSVIPVSVASWSAHSWEHGSVVVASSTPVASSHIRVHGVADPTGVSGEHGRWPSPSPSPEVVPFTGNAGRVAKIEGVFGVLAGVFTLVAFAL